MEKFECLSVKIDNCTLGQIIKKIPEFLSSPEQHHIVTVNAEYVLEAQKDREFRDIINSANLRVADGIGPIWAAKFLSLPASECKILRYPQVVVQYICTGASLVFFSPYCKSVIPERVSGVDILEEILNPLTCHPEVSKTLKDPIDQGTNLNITEKPLNNGIPAPSLTVLRHSVATRRREALATHSRRFTPRDDKMIFLLGGFNKAGEIAKEKYPDANIVGTFEGSPDLEDDEEARGAINRVRPNILFVAYGNPASKQEKWISRNLPRLPSVRVVMGVGGSFDFLSGQVKRAPKIMQKLGIEWLYRLIRQPRRVKRIWNAVIVFSFKILLLKLETGET